MKTILITLILLFCVACRKPSGFIVDSHQLKSWGYFTKSIEKDIQTDWEKKQFGTARVIKQKIKAAEPTSKNSETYFRFTIRQETYHNANFAQNRIKKMFFRPPGLNTKMNPEYLLRDGFSIGKDAFIISTDVLSFSKTELPMLVKKLKMYFNHN